MKSKLVRLTSTHDGLFNNDKFEQKRHSLYLNIFNTFSTNRSTVRLIYVLTNRPEDPVEKEIGNCGRARQ